jgi:hypothetical protein
MNNSLLKAIDLKKYLKTSKGLQALDLYLVTFNKLIIFFNKISKQKNAKTCLISNSGI